MGTLRKGGNGSVIKLCARDIKPEARSREGLAKPRETGVRSYESRCQPDADSRTIADGERNNPVEQPVNYIKLFFIGYEIQVLIEIIVVFSFS